MNTETSKPVVVCLHGGAASSAAWREFRHAVRGRAEVVTPEIVALDDTLPGREASLVASVERQLAGIESPFHLVGHGLGGAIATQFAARYPDRVLSLVLYEPAHIDAALVERTDVPLRLIAGTRSWEVMRRRMERAVKMWPRVTLLKLVGLRHMAPVTHPHIVNPVILDYILPVSMPGQAA